MKNKIFILLLFFIPVHMFGQSVTDPVGIWKIIVEASGFKAGNTKITYLKLDKDQTYIWGIDSTAADPMDGVTKGKWELDSLGEIRLAPDDKDREISYYVPTDDGSKFRYRYTEKEGKKEPVFMLEMDIYIQKYVGL